ncbi:GIP [Symbiodinium sp. CCMP2592]|nr:GIP [Symbiodinium sp. CCMP2592]
MDNGGEPNYSNAFPDVSPAEMHQQGMSPNHADATAAHDAQGHAGDTTVVAGGQGAAQVQETELAVRAMAVAVATDQSPSGSNWPMDGQAAPVGEPTRGPTEAMGVPYGQMNAAQASWSMMATRRTAPAWIQRLGAFFQEMRAQQPAPMWNPSPLGSPPSGGRAMGSPESEQGVWMSQAHTDRPLLTRGQREQPQRMEQRAPLLYGHQQRYEGEVVGVRMKRCKMRSEDSCVMWWSSWRQEASELRREMGACKRPVSWRIRDLSNGLSRKARRELWEGTWQGSYVFRRTYRAFYAEGIGIFYERGIGLAIGCYHNKCAGAAYRIFYQRGIGLAIGYYHNRLEKVMKGGTKPEELSKVVEGPKLPEISESSSVDFGDWLYCLEHTMGDISTNSAEWWKLVVKDAQEYYDKYQAADQYGRLSMKPDVKKELIASRAKSTLDVLARLMVLYRPGSAMEKGQLLKKIETPEPCTTTQDAVEGLRQWLRYYQRAKDLKLSIPDPLNLVKALDGMLKKPDNVLAIHRAFLAEFEQMGYKKKAKQGGDPTPAPRLRAMEKEQPQLPTLPVKDGKGGQKPCRFYLSDEGCRRGKGCRFEHTMKDLSKAERRDRCYECGAKGHLSASCPTRKEPQQRALGVGDSPQSSTGGTNGRKGGGSAKGPKGAGAEEAEATNAVPAEVAATATPSGDTPVQGVPVEQLLEDAQRLMKAFMEQKSGPQVKVFRVEDVKTPELQETPALKELMRQGQRDVGWGEHKVEMQQSRSGTILGSEGTQAIVPLGTVVKQLGYEFGWNRRGCFLRHPDKGEIRVYTRSTCPEILQKDALRLIGELEEAKLAETMESLATLKAAVAAARGHTQWTWKDAIKEYVSAGEQEAGVRAVLAAPFMHHVPMEDQLKIMAAIPSSSEEAWKWMKSFPLNRAKRRQLWQAPEWVVHMFSGKGVKNDPLREVQGLLEIDLQRGWNLNDDKIYGVLLWAALNKKIKHVVGGPPGGTFSPYRYRDGTEGPRPVRSNHEPWGLREGLGVDESAKVKNENRMLLRMVWLWAFAEAAQDDPEVPGHKVGFCLEFPEDPREYLPDGPQKSQCVSMWRMELVQVTHFEKVQFEQGALGHMLRKPACCLTNLRLGIHGVRDSRAWVSADGADPDQSVWPHGFRLTLADAIHEWNIVGGGVALKKAMTKTELEEWRNHLDRGHWPYRRDCSVCLAASGTGRPARRVVHRDAYVLSLDIVGPFADVGRDEVRGCRYRFALAATYLYPKIREVPEDAPIPDEEEAEKFLAEEEDQPEDGEQGPEDPDADAQEEEWKKKVEDLRRPMEMQALRFVVPLERHRGKEVLEAVQELYIRIRTLGLPIVRLHSDRAREFRVKPLRRWCRDRDIYQTYTEGLAPSQNAAAESHVKWLKGKARLHLQDAELDKELWPCAMKHACKLHNARELGEKAPEIRFGAVVWVKSKKDRGPFDPRWERGVYMGPADDVREGHVVRLDDGLWLRTLHMRTVRDDEVEDEDDEEFVVDLVEPTRRLRRKTKLADPELRALDVKGRKALVERLLASSIWESPEAKVERPQMKDGDAWDGAAYVNLGAYQHGGITSITVATEKFAQEAEWAATLLSIDHPGKVFTSVALVKNATMPLHEDAFNLKSTVNLVSPLRVSKGSCVWQELKPGDEFYGKYKSMWFKEKEVPGQLFSVEKPTTVRPDRLHAPLRGEEGLYDGAGNGDYGGVRYGGELGNGANGASFEFIGELRYCPEGSQENVVMTSTPLMPLGHDEEEHLRRRVSWLSDLVEEERQVRRAKEARGEYASQRERQMFYKLDEAIDYMNELLDNTRQQNRVNLMRMAVGSSASENVEEMLQSLGKPLETVHTVDLQEVKRHLQEWTPSIAKEVQTLEGSGTLRGLPLQEAKERVKEMGRSRIVICGNYIHNEVEVYTASANAESVRCSLSYGAKRKWHGAVTDVNSAFTLTPMTESKVRYAITMPKVVVDAGCAPPNTAYSVDRVLYGLREAPRLWGSFRDRRISRAKLKVGDKQCVFLQMETDPAVWRLVEIGNESHTLAMMIVYVDDAMMLGPVDIINVMYEWLTKGTEEEGGWKCSPLEWLGKEPVRYLGMDVRRKELGDITSFHISQGSYVAELLRNYPEEAARPSQVPATKESMPQNEEVDEEEVVVFDGDLVKQAQKMAGELLWLLTRTRPDVGFATAHVCSAATKDPNTAIRLAKMTMRYLAATPTMGLCYDGQGGPVVAYSDASFAPQGDRSFGCVTTATYGGFAAWRMTKQPTIALSAAEAELVELVNASQQAAGLQAWVNEVSTEDMEEPMVLRVDNTAACGLATTSPGSWKTRHLKVKARHLRMETSEGRIHVVHTPGEVQVADMGTKPVPVARLVELRRLWGMCTAEEFEKKDQEVIIKSLQGPEYYDLLRMFVWLMMMNNLPVVEAADVYHKKPLDYDGSFEFYGLLLIGGVALLGIWETLKWVAHKIFGDDEMTLAKARRLMRIRNQASRALQEELASMSASSADPMYEEKPKVLMGGTKAMPAEPLGVAATSSEVSTTPATTRAMPATPATSSAAPTTPVVPSAVPTTAAFSAAARAEDDPDLRAALEQAQNGQYRRLRKSFVMSEHGDRLHAVPNCHGLRHANKTRLKQMQVCYYCDGNFPLYYKVTRGQVLPEG